MDPDATSMFGRTILILGAVLAGLGLLVLLAPRLPSWVGRLPGDLSFRRGPVGVFVPLGTCLLISLILTLVFSLISWLRR